MKNQMNTCSLLILVFLIGIKIIYPQSGDNIIEDIDNAIKSEFGTDFNLQSVETVDSSYKVSKYGFPLFDPFGTLNDSYIFTAIKDNEEIGQTDVGIVGIYGNDQIIWASGSSIFVKELSNAEIIAVLDLNIDGDIDIVTAWFKWVSSDFYDVWIYSWNGSSGSLISELDENDQSNIKGYDLALLDRDGDGIEELCGNIGCYSWNGSLYGKWDSNPLPESVPKDGLNATVKCTVGLELNGFKFSYLISNNISSKQQIEQFGIDIESANISNFAKPENWDFYYVEEELFISSEVNLPVDIHFNDLIKAGEEKGVYTFNSLGLPKINNIYIQGYNGERDFDVQNIKSNSFITQTLSPIDPPDSLIQLNFLDTLLNYNQHSLDLDWITNQTTADKYDSLFNTAKTLLEGNHIPWVEYTLQSALDECNSDSSGNITSEAYALLRFNTEYLLENLPEIIPPVLNSMSPEVTLMPELEANLYYSPEFDFTLTLTGNSFTDSSIIYFDNEQIETTFISDSIVTCQIIANYIATTGTYPVWVSNYDSNSDTLFLSAFDSLPDSVTPVVNCIQDNGDDNYTAWLGYINNNSTSVHIGYGETNMFGPCSLEYPINLGQPNIFLPGEQTNVFTIEFSTTGTPPCVDYYKWILDRASVDAANSRAPECE